jgi:segregation and condensation protein B
LFLEKMGLTSLDELPPIAPYLPDAMELEAELTGLASSQLPLPADESVADTAANPARRHYDPDPEPRSESDEGHFGGIVKVDEVGE